MGDLHPQGNHLQSEKPTFMYILLVFSAQSWEPIFTSRKTRILNLLKKYFSPKSTEIEIPPHKYKHISKTHQVPEENQSEKELTLEATEFTKKTKGNYKLIISSTLREMRGYHNNKKLVWKSDQSGWTTETIPQLHTKRSQYMSWIA